MLDIRKSLFWFLFVLLIMSLMVTSVSAAPVARAPGVYFLQAGGDPNAPPPISPGIPSAIAIGALISFLLDNLPFLKDWFNSLSSGIQKWIVVLACALGGVGIFLATNPPGVLQVMTVPLWLLLIQNIIVAIGSSQLWYKGPGKTLVTDSASSKG